MKLQKVEMSFRTIIYTILLLLSLVVVWLIKDMIILLFVCFLFMEALNPTVTKLEKFKIPRFSAILIIYLIILLIISVSVAGIIPIFVQQSTSLINNLPGYLQNIKIFGIPAIDLSSQFKIFESLPQEIAKTIIGVFSNIFTALIFFVVTFYLLLERKNFDDYSLKLFGNDGQKKVIKILDNLESRLGNWVTAEILLMTIIGVLSYFGYLALGLNYAVPLAIIAGLLEIVPNIGPIISGGLAIIIGLTVSPITALLTAIWSLILHQSENTFITPKIMKETVGLHPLVTIFLIAIGARLAGIPGALLAVPIYLTVEVVYKVLNDKK